MLNDETRVIASAEGQDKREGAREPTIASSGDKSRQGFNHSKTSCFHWR
jgi:hypothetical protein